MHGINNKYEEYFMRLSPLYYLSNSGTQNLALPTTIRRTTANYRMSAVLPPSNSGESICEDDARHGTRDAAHGADARFLRELVQQPPHPGGRFEVQAGGDDAWAWQGVGDCQRSSRAGGDEPI